MLSADEEAIKNGLMIHHEAPEPAAESATYTQTQD
jgi:hypothetical protein